MKRGQVSAPPEIPVAAATLASFPRKPESRSDVGTRCAPAPCHPAKENPDAAYHAGAQERAASDGRIVSGRLVTGTATLLPAHQLAPLLPTKCELLHIRPFFVFSVHSPMYSVSAPAATPSVTGAPRLGSVAAPTALAQPKIRGARPRAHNAAFPSLSSSYKAIGRWSCSEVSSSRQGIRHGQATTLGYPCLVPAPALCCGQLRPPGAPRPRIGALVALTTSARKITRLQSIKHFG